MCGYVISPSSFCMVLLLYDQNFLVSVIVNKEKSFSLDIMALLGGCYF